jgi:DNA primase
VKECAKLLEMDEQVLVRTIAKKRQEILLQKKKTLYPDPENPEDALQTHQRPPVEEKTPSNLEPLATGKPSVLEEHEKAILYYTIRYGEQVLYTDTDNESQEEIPVKVIDFIIKELNKDELEFTHPLYKQILLEAHIKSKEGNFIPEAYFINHPDPQFSRLAVDLSTNKYIESKIHFRHRKKEEESGKLLNLVPYAIHNYKDAILKKRMEELSLKIKIAGEDDDLESLTELIRQQQEWQETRKEIAIHLGERIITK